MTTGERVVRAAAIQMAMDTSLDRNTRAAIDRIRDAAARGARLICLPELFRSRYFCQSEDAELFALAEPIPGPTTARLDEVAKELDVVIVASLFERRAPGLYHNTAAVFDGRDGYAGMYRKMHIPDDPRYYEKFFFTPGDLGFKCFSTRAGNVGVLICWDQWYPEAARLTALAGADVLVYPTAIGWHPEEKDEVGEQQHSAWQTVQRGHAIANGNYVVSVNRTGFEPGPDGGGIEFWGRSFMAGPSGELIAEASDSPQESLIADLDYAQAERTRINWPFFRDRRIDAYKDIGRRYIDAQ
ncbi:MAG TPA: carbon-nitrogen hydrolase [Gammaproteobacteria bacterium]|nr:carbon-nitrogen hydrolase [Gammaproteobacteria bacterium]